MLGQVAVIHGAFAVRTVHQRQQQGVLELDALKGLEGLQADAVGGVGVAVLVHHLLGITVGSGDLLVGQLTAQCLEAGIHSSQRFQRLLGLLGHIVADHGGLAAVRVSGDRLLQKGFYIRGILIAAGQLCRLLIGSVLGQQIHAGGDLKITDAAHGIRGGNGAACKAEGECQRADQCKKFLFHGNAPSI